MEARDDWETYMRRYLRRLYSLRVMAGLSPPPGIAERNQELIRESWKSLLTAVKIDFGPKLVDPQTHEFLNARFLAIAAEIGMENLHARVIAWGRPCEHCVHGKDPEELLEAEGDLSTMTQDELVQLNCKAKEPEQQERPLPIGRFTFSVGVCQEFTTFDILNKSEQAVRDDIYGYLEEGVSEFEEWREGLSFSEQLLT